METHQGNVLFFLTVLLCSAGVCVNAQGTNTAAQNNVTSPVPTIVSTDSNTTTPVPTNSSTNATSTAPNVNSTDPANSTSSNMTSPTPTVTNQTTAVTVTNATSAPTTTMQPTTVRDYCANMPCVHGNCSSLTTMYTCSCNEGWTGDNCDNELVIWPGYNSSVATAATSNTMQSSKPFAYFNRAVTELSMYADGYASLGEDFFSDNAPEGTAWPYAPDLFGIYWADIQPKNNGSSFYYTWTERTTDNIMNSSSLIQYVKDVVNMSSFEPLILFAATWVDVVPEPAANFSNDKATFQLILASDTQYSYAIRNYQKVWENVDSYGRPRVSAAYTRENGSKQGLDVPQNKTGKLVTQLFTSGTPTRDPYLCIQKVSNVSSSLGNAVRSLPKCPCQISQVKADSWFETMNASSLCYQSVLDRSGLKQQCCYNSFGLLNGNSTAASIPVQMNASDASLQEAFMMCCNMVPQLCSVFYGNFPSTDCGLYTVPYTAAIFGKTYTVTFDNNKYSFNGLGDFVLFKSGEVEIQIKTQMNANTNTTSILALAVKTADNTSSIQIYAQASNLTSNFTSSPATRPVDNTYVIRPMQSGVILWLPTVFLSVTNTAGSLLCTIRFNSKDSNTQGLLGSADSISTNDFRLRNGSDLSSTAEKLSIQAINEFVLSWQVRNATESLFDNPSLPANDSANSTTKFVPSLLPANVNETLKLFNPSVVAEVSQLCTTELFCVQEYYYTSSSNTSASAVLQVANIISVSKAQASMKAPAFANMERNISIVNSGPSPFTLNLSVQDGMNVTFNTVSSFTNRSFHLDNSTFTWNVSADLTMLRTLSYPRNLKFYATNDANMSAEYAPTISLCLCEQASQCGQMGMIQYHFTNETAANGNVNLRLCNCGDRADGRFCEISVDVCTNCFNTTACNATKLNDYCAACPSGYGGDGKYCYDKNECLDNKGGCQDICTNTPGSFQCSCSPGFTANGTTCTDINECLDNPNICNDYLKVCTNEPGSYSCACFPTLVGEDKCIRAPFSYVGSADLADSVDQAWNTSLTNKTSAYFKQLSGKVANAITRKLTAGNIGNTDALFVEILSFSQAQNAVRTKRQATTPNSRVMTIFVIYLANNTITADELNIILRNGNTTCNGSCQYDGITILTYPQVDSKSNLCNYTEIHKCDESTTMCVQSGQTTSCNCKDGYQFSTLDNHYCRDIDECLKNATETCPQTGVCINKPGSYMCACSEGQFWDANATQCAADGCAAKPCQNGVCYPLKNSTDYTCKCNSGWEGGFCENEDAEAYRMKVAVICISVILGVLCLVLLIVLIVMCVRKHRTLENDSYTNSRYSEAEHLPRVKIAHRPGTEMSENGQGNTYERLSSGSVGDKHTFGQHAPTSDSRNNGSKDVYHNRAYEEDVGERL